MVAQTVAKETKKGRAKKEGKKRGGSKVSGKSSKGEVGTILVFEEDLRVITSGLNRFNRLGSIYIKIITKRTLLT